MPCDSITTQTVALAKADPSILLDALKADGWTVQTAIPGRIDAYAGPTFVVWQAGAGLTVQGTDNARTVQRVTRAYSRQAVTWAARRAGWTVKQNADDTLSVSRR